MPEKYFCRSCSKQVTATKNRRYRSHSDGEGEPCENGSVEIPEDLLAVEKGAAPEVPVEGEDFRTCPDCRRKVKLTSNGYYEHHTVTLRGTERCLRAGTRPRPLKATVESAAGDKKPTEVITLPGDSLPERGLAATRPEQGKSDSGYALDLAREKLKAASTEVMDSPTSGSSIPESSGSSTWQTENPTAARNLERQPMEPSPESTPTSSLSAGYGPPEPSPFSLVIHQPDYGVRQPGLYMVVICQPAEYATTPAVKLDGEAALLAARVKETFYAYSNRKTSDNRGAQTTLGPSEIGTPCDRRLAMELMDVPYTNAGGDGWASFVGTRGHLGMAEIYEWANAGSGRYAVEIPLTFGSIVVPRGTSDLLDRREFQIVDWKFMGKYSLDKFKKEGASVTYLTQGQVYGYGVELSGETVKSVAIVGLPRAGSSLNEMHVQVVKYDRNAAKAAIDRVESIHAKVQEIRRPDGLGDTPGAMSTAQQFGTADDCRFCPFFLKGDQEMLKGCPGR